MNTADTWLFPGLVFYRNDGSGILAKTTRATVLEPTEASK